MVGQSYFYFFQVDLFKGCIYYFNYITGKWSYISKSKIFAKACTIYISWVKTKSIYCIKHFTINSLFLKLWALPKIITTAIFSGIILIWQFMNKKDKIPLHMSAVLNNAIFITFIILFIIKIKETFNKR